MNKSTIGIILLSVIVSFSACKSDSESTLKMNVDQPESFADLQILTYKVPGWDKLDPKQKELAYYLYEAALSGRDIIYDQRGKYNLTIRKTIEAIWENPDIDKSGDEWEAFKTYSGQVWFSNGIYHHYSNDKFTPSFTEGYFSKLVNTIDPQRLPLEVGEDIDAFVARLRPIIFDPNFVPKMVNLKDGIDNVAESANNFYEGISQKEVEKFYAKFPQSDHEPEWGLNSKLIKKDGAVTEQVWKSGGMYGAAIDKVIYWLEKATTVAENDQQKKSLSLLIDYYKTGDLKKWDEYNISWVQDTTSVIDFANGFIEVYNDALGIKGSFEGVLSLRDFETTKRIKAIADEAQWFEDHSPLQQEHKKKVVKGISAKAITVIVESGDAAPSTPIGINLPNSDWIRKDYGSKSVSLSNIIHAYNESSANSGFLEEFVKDLSLIHI